MTPLLVPALLVTAILAAGVLAGEVLAADVAIPAGSFRQGGGGPPDEAPVRTVTLSAYRISTTEVTVAEFEAFVARGGYQDAAWWSPEGLAWLKGHPEGAGEELRRSGRTPAHPVVAVTWYEADAWCRSQGGALPTEAQWEHAACHGDGGRYPWGDEENFAAAWYGEGKTGGVKSVHTRTAAEADPALVSPFGLVHAAGNVWEWTADGYRADSYAEGDATDPRGATGTPWKTLRGGSYMNLPSYCTCTHREPASPEEVRLTIGFRCAWPA